ncbi:MAG: hemoglobin/transferrin/lactoferrin receptor protein, partial [Francisellaceae bacterium]
TKAKKNKSESMAKQKQKSGQSLPVLSELNSNPENGNSTLKDLNNMGGVMLEGGARAITQNINIGGLSGDQVYVAVDGINNQLTDFRHGHNSARQLPNPFLFKQVSASAGGTNILYGSGNLGGAVNFVTVDPSDFIHDDKWYGGSLTFGAESGAPGGNVGGAVAFKAKEVSVLFDVVGAQNNDVRLGQGGTLDNSSSENLQYLAKAVWDIDTSQQIKASFLSMHNSGKYPANNNKVQSDGNPATQFDFLQQQSNLIYTYNPNNPYIDFKIQGFLQS